MAISTNTMIQPLSATEIVYPESDGKPLSDNPIQFRLITVIQGNLDALVPDFVAGDLNWYPVQGQPTICTAPDVMVALGRPKGDRGSYRQWEEGNIPPQVVFEIASPSNTRSELEETKLKFYQTYGVEEYYLYDPGRGQLKGWWRRGKQLDPIASMLGWVSPRLGIRFELEEGELKLFFPNGERFSTYVELMARAKQAEAQLEIERQEKERERQEKERERQEKERERQEKERERQEKERERQGRLEAEALAAQLAARLQALGIDPEDIE